VRVVSGATGWGRLSLICAVGSCRARRNRQPTQLACEGVSDAARGLELVRVVERRRIVALAQRAVAAWPAASIVTWLFRTWATDRAVPTELAGGMQSTEMGTASSSARESISLPKPRESTQKPRIWEEVRLDYNNSICRDFPCAGRISPIIRVVRSPVQIRAPRFICAGLQGFCSEESAGESGSWIVGMGSGGRNPFNLFEQEVPARW
jgi:hypothetical protein